MYRVLLTEIVRVGREEEDKAYRKEAEPVLKKYGMKATVWRVEGRKAGQVLIDWGNFESKEQADERVARLFEDEEWKRLQHERNEAGTIIPGTMEVLVLTDY